MQETFRQFWWLIFPLSWFVFGAYQSWLSYKANRDTLDLIKTYAQSGREPPPELLAKLNKRWNDGNGLNDPDEEDEDDRAHRRYHRRRYRRYHGWSRVALFGCLCAGFAFAAMTGLYGEASQAFIIVAFVMGALAVSSVVAILVDRGPRL